MQKSAAVPVSTSTAVSGDRLSEQVAGILGSRDPLDALTFDHIAHINNTFPTEQSFSQADKVMIKMKSKIRQMEREMRDLLREQAEGLNAGGTNADLDTINKCIKQLSTDIIEIGNKTRHAEETVQSITHDIKALDCAKKNLITSVTVLRRLQMLQNALLQLKQVIQLHKFSAMPPLIQAVTELSAQFSTFKAVPQVNGLLEDVKLITANLKKDSFHIFEQSFTSQGTLVPTQSSELSQICLVIEALGPETKKQMLDWYVDLQLREYCSIFRPEDEVGNLDNLPRRFAFLKRICKNFDEEQVGVFPKEWNPSLLFCKKFCEHTKTHLNTLLAGKMRTSSLDVKQLIKNLQLTQEFENGLNMRFASMHDDGEPADPSSALDVPSLFNGDLSFAFEPYMYLYIDAENKNLNDMVEKFKQITTLSDEDLNTGVFSASTDLFFFYKQTLINMSKLNTGKPFADLCQLFGKWLINFCDAMSAKIPKDERKTPTNDDIKMTCIILNTAEYCQNTTSQLEEKIQEKINAEYKQVVEMNHPKELFLLLSTTAIQAIVRLICSSLAPPLQSMTKISWATMQTVGDQSEYVTNIATILSRNVKDIRKLITNVKHFKWFCDKFVDSFVPMFVKNIHLCKPISEAGAEQMLLDAHAIKTFLLELPNIGADEKEPVSSVYTRFVTKGMVKVETLLKIVLTPLNPPGLIIKNFMILTTEQNNSTDPNAPDGGSAAAGQVQLYSSQKITEMKDNFIKILDLKGVKRNDQQPLVDALLKRLPKQPDPISTGLVDARATSSTAATKPQKPIVPASPSMPAFNTVSTTITPATPVSNKTPSTPLTQNPSAIKPINISVSDASAKLNENLKKITANWMKRND